MNEGFELLNGSFYWLPDELTLEKKIKNKKNEKETVW